MTAIVMYAFSTAHVITDFARGIVAFIDYKKSPNGALDYIAQLWVWSNVFREALYATNNIVADSLVVYRCYVVWGAKFKVVVIPIIMLISTSVCAYAAVYNFSTVKPGEDVFISNIAHWGTALFSLSLVTNVTVTSLIG
ncbi:hypothetical protein VKT23_002551 [Stygiomarasmius scandens]|uniref:Uncharacterized protein n=1 Tax=Marasmiellus scandens TaxID=2682957 RepID=A0ABR1K532_9AGAR